MNKKLLFLSLYYPPDIGPGSFRIKSIIDTIDNKKLSKTYLITSYPFRYPDFKISFDDFKKLYNLTSNNFDIYEKDNLNIYRNKLRAHKNTMISQILSYFKYFFYVIKISISIKPDLIFATSGRLMTAFLAYIVSKLTKATLIIEIRDIFSYGIKNHNFFKIKILNIIFSKIFFRIEKLIINRSKQVNFVSQEFANYYNVKFDKKFKFYPNGIDYEFLKFNFKKPNNKSKSKIINILYVGNIGEAQNLHNFLPEFSERLPKNYIINIIGSGGGKSFLTNEINKRKLKNIYVLDPIPKINLLNKYKNADILLMNLADKDVFKSVIPSKIYEYIITGKPILIGCKGEVEKYKKYTKNLFFFKPSDHNSAIDVLKKINIKNSKVTKNTLFEKKYSRKNISKNIVKDIINSISN